MILEPPAKRLDEAPNTVEMASPTAWPVVLAFGITLVFAGMLTTASVSILGALLALCGYAGWFRDVLPREKRESVPVLEEPALVFTSRPMVARVNWNTHDPHRARLPLETYPVSAGVKGGMAGCVAMALLAMAYGLVVQHSIWYPINLLAAGFLTGEETTAAQLAAFQPTLLIVASIIHLVTSLLVGLLYGAMLPMFPRRPILLGGVIAPVLWSGMIHGLVEFLSPVVGSQINWPWYVITQVGFGIVAGIVVSTQQRVRTWQHLPFAVRAGFEAPGIMNERDGEDSRQ
uniref:Uncharacterized protein n=1 Tax=Solibacter usitatus (strain Ellin6076) TaxID=234267 RepID=Q01PC9_SOLUE